MIQFKLNGKPISFPSCWEDLTFRQYLKIFTLEDDVIHVVSILSGIDYEILKKSTISGLNEVIMVASFLKTSPVISVTPKKIGKYDLPLNSKGEFDIQFESLGQFEDMRKFMKNIPSNNIIEHFKAFSTYAALYLQKIRDKEYNYDKAIKMIDEVELMPALEVISAGSFFLVKLATLSNGIQKVSQATPLNQKKKIQVSHKSNKRSGRMAPLLKSRKR